MLNAADFNAKVDEYAQRVLIPNGFKKSGLHHFKNEPPHYYALIKDTFKGTFVDYYLVYCHEAAGENYKAVFKKPKSLLRHYPVSVNIRELPIIYTVADHPAASPYTFFNMARSYHVNQHCIESQEVWEASFQYRWERDEKLKTDAEYLDKYIKELFEIITQYGFRFFEHCNLELCYHSIEDAIVNNKNETYLPWYLEYKNDFNRYCELNDINIPTLMVSDRKKSIFQRVVSFFTKN